MIVFKQVSQNYQTDGPLNISCGDIAVSSCRYAQIQRAFGPQDAVTFWLTPGYFF